MSELLHMGDYGICVGAAYGITLFVFGINLFIAVLEKQQVKKIIQQHLAQDSNA